MGRVLRNFCPSSDFLRGPIGCSTFISGSQLRVTSTNVSPIMLVGGAACPVDSTFHSSSSGRMILSGFRARGAVIHHPSTVRCDCSGLRDIVERRHTALHGDMTVGTMRTCTPAGSARGAPIVLAAKLSAGNHGHVTFTSVLALGRQFSRTRVPLRRHCVILRPGRMSSLLLRSVRLFGRLAGVGSKRPFGFTKFNYCSFTRVPACGRINNVLGGMPFNDRGAMRFTDITFCTGRIVGTSNDVCVCTDRSSPGRHTAVMNFSGHFITLPVQKEKINTVIDSGTWGGCVGRTHGCGATRGGNS